MSSTTTTPSNADPRGSLASCIPEELTAVTASIAAALQDLTEAMISVIKEEFSGGGAQVFLQACGAKVVETGGSSVLLAHWFDRVSTQIADTMEERDMDTGCKLVEGAIHMRKVLDDVSVIPFTLAEFTDRDVKDQIQATLTFYDDTVESLNKVRMAQVMRVMAEAPSMQAGGSGRLSTWSSKETESERISKAEGEEMTEQQSGRSLFTRKYNRFGLGLGLAAAAAAGVVAAGCWYGLTKATETAMTESQRFS